MLNRSVRLVIGAAAGAVVLLAANVSTAAAATPPPPDQCRGMGYDYGVTCFQWNGDKQWVEDRVANGWAIVVHSQTNYGKDRYCQSLPAADGWAYCDYDHIEGKCVRFMMYELKDGVTRNPSGWSLWYGTEYGSPC